MLQILSLPTWLIIALHLAEAQDVMELVKVIALALAIQVVLLDVKVALMALQVALTYVLLAVLAVLLDVPLFVKDAAVLAMVAEIAKVLV